MATWHIVIGGHPPFQWNHSCSNCGIQLLSTERDSNGRGFCCRDPNSNRHQYRLLPALPPQIDAIAGEHAISGQSRSLNLIFSFASLETTANFPVVPGGFIAIQGKVYHRIRPHHASSAVRWILYDGFENASAPHTAIFASLPPHWIDAVRDALTHSNPFVQRLQALSLYVPTQQTNLRIELLEDTQPELVALLRFDSTSRSGITPRRLTVRLNDNTIEHVPSTSRLWEPLAYPLFFPHGTLGWGTNGTRNNVLLQFFNID
jgi:hypothetical protein